MGLWLRYQEEHGTGLVKLLLDVGYGVNLKASEFELTDVPVKRGGSIGTRENVFRHEEAPLDVLPVGTLAEAGDLTIGVMFRDM